MPACIAKQVQTGLLALPLSITQQTAYKVGVYDDSRCLCHPAVVQLEGTVLHLH